jgi:hypothetical protein
MIVGGQNFLNFFQIQNASLRLVGVRILVQIGPNIDGTNIFSSVQFSKNIILPKENLCGRILRVVI